MRRTLTAWAVLILLPLVARADEQSWRSLTNPTLADIALAFPQPPKEYRAIHWAIWGGQQTRERILADIEHVDASGGGVYMLNNSRNLQPKYFTPEYLNLVKYVVDECKKRGMKVWIEGDAGYPDGFAGGMISRDYPQLGMQAIVADARYPVASGQTLSIPLPTDTLGILASQRGDGAGTAAGGEAGKNIPLPSDGNLKWTAPSGSSWDVVLHETNAEGHYSVVAGQTLSLKLPADTKSIDAAPRAGVRGLGGRGGGGGQPPIIVPMPADGQLNWKAPDNGNWEVAFVRHVYRSSPTRFSDREDGTSDKDALYSLIDYLDPQATATYLKLIHEQYEKIVGDEFGKTILGFRGDETDYTGIIPWTPKLLETFKAEKGYDLQPYLPLFFAGQLTPEARKAKADYWDVWSGMFRDNFYKPLEEWCNARGMEYMFHLNHEETMLGRGEGMISNEGSFWRDMRYVGVPGVDNLNQIGPGIVADFPKIAVSAAHMNCRPLVWDEDLGGLGQSGKFIADYQMVRGMNYGNIRGLNNAPPADSGALANPSAATGWYVGRAQYLLAMGRPAAQIALFQATDSYWLGDQEADTVQLKIVTEMLEHQIDFDHIDSDAITSVCKLEDGGLKNLSGQVYRAVIVPTSTVIQKGVLDRLRDFAAGGGKVIFVGRTPSMVVDKNFLHAGGPPDLSFATLEARPDITDAVVAALPKPDVKLDSPCPPIKYIHRVDKDGDVYFFFNESAESQARTASVVGTGQVQIWDPSDGTIHPLAGVTPATGSVDVPLVLAPHESRFVVIGPLPPGAGQPLPTLLPSETLQPLDGNWSITLGDTRTDSPLKSWQELGAGSFNGIAQYSKTFDIATPPAGQRIYIDLGNVSEIAHIKLNGKDYDSRSWPSYVWDITDSIKPGTNTLEVQVQVPANGGRGGGFGGGAGAGRNGAGGRGRAAAPPPPAATPAPSSPHGLFGPVRVIAR